MNQDRFVLRAGDNLNLDYSLQINDYTTTLRLTRLIVEKIDHHSCTVFIDCEVNDDSVLKRIRTEMNEGLISYAEKKGGFISATEMREYLEKQQFIKNLKGKE